MSLNEKNGQLDLTKPDSQTLTLVLNLLLYGLAVVVKIQKNVF